MGAMSSKSILRLGALLSVVACATKSKPIVVFPGADVLEEIGARPAALPPFDEGAVPASGWTVDLPGAPPSAFTSVTASSPAEKAIMAALAAKGTQARLVPALQCAARELERFAADTGKGAPMMLREFIAGACGALTVGLGYQGSEATADASYSEDDLVNKAPGGFATSLVRAVPTGPLDVGVAFVRRGTRARVLLAFAKPVSGVQAFAPMPDEGGEVTLSGTIADQVQYVGGSINQGRTGVVSCYVDPTVLPPRWKVTCPLAADDESARLDLYYAQPGRVLAMPLLSTIVRRASASKLSYRPTTFPELPAAGNAAAFATAVVETLNRVRGEAGLSPVRLATAQSATAARVAPTYFSGALGPRDDQQLDVIALGLLAGWNVTAMIRGGNFSSNFIPTTRDPNRWLSATLERPAGRLTLLAPEIEEIALGPVLSTAPEGSGAVVVGYQFHHGAEHDRDVGRLSGRLVLARKKRALPLPRPLPGMAEPLRAAMAEINAGRKQPLEALDELMQLGVSRLHQSMRGYIVETTSLDALTMPEEILTQPDLQFQIGVTHHKPEGAAWAQFVIIVLFADSGPGDRV
jgi:hypothetical protein